MKRSKPRWVSSVTADGWNPKLKGNEQEAGSAYWDHVSSSPHLVFRTYSPLRSFPAALLFCRHLSDGNTVLPHKVQWSALFLSPGSNYLESPPCFWPSFSLSQFFPIFLENLSLFKKPFFCPIAWRYEYVCVWTVCVDSWKRTFKECVYI